MDLFSGCRDIGFICGGYALGCISTGYYLVRFRAGVDIRTIDSGATGSTNVCRVLGTPGFVVTLVVDAAKAFVAVWAAHLFRISPWAVAGVMIAVVAGHIWPAQLGFHGGKGLAAGLGVLTAIDYRAAIICGGIAILGPLLRSGTATFLLAAVAAPGVLTLLDHSTADLTGMSAVVLLALFAHRDNIRAYLAERRGRKGLQA